jgi:two-component system chemotaxis response regulator CheY
MDSEKRILIVDDSATMRRIARSLLKSLGFEDVAEAEDGRQALDAIEAGAFDLVLSDCNMPNMSGLELLNTLRGEPGPNDIPFVVMTSPEQKESLLEMVKAGANDYIEKPFKADALQEKLEKFFN